MIRVFYLVVLLLLVGLGGTLTTLYLARNSRPVIGCFDVDGGIRPRTRCILNPFRDRKLEEKAEAALLRLRDGDASVLVPLLGDQSADNRNHVLENEAKWRIESWRIGEWAVQDAEPSLMYWVTREKYKGEEEVRFHLKRVGADWEMVGYSAIY